MAVNSVVENNVEEDTSFDSVRVSLDTLSVGNELGAGKPYRAKLAATVALGCAFIVGIINVTWTAMLKERWANLFIKDDSVKALVISVMPIMGLCELGNCPQTTGCGILRGTARPAVAARINLGSFYFIGIPVAVGLAFWFKVGFGGLWYGLLAAQAACAISILYVVWAQTDWEAEALKAKKFTTAAAVGGSASSCCIALEEMQKDLQVVVEEDECKRFLDNGNQS